MVDFIGIENKLRRLDAEYNNNMQDPDLPVFYSKLAVLEFSGWLEDSIDDILFRYIDSHILDTKVRDEIRKSVRKNYGFHYYNNLFKLFTSVLGVNNWENIEDALKPQKFHDLIDVANTYSGIRNQAAHSSIVVMHTFYSPSSTIAAYNRVKPAIMAIDNEISKL